MVESKIEIKIYIDVLVFCKRTVSMATVRTTMFFKEISVSNIQEKHGVIITLFFFWCYRCIKKMILNMFLKHI
jgi:hypothetical protein